MDDFLAGLLILVVGMIGGVAFLAWFANLGEQPQRPKQIANEPPIGPAEGDVATCAEFAKLGRPRCAILAVVDGRVSSGKPLEMAHLVAELRKDLVDMHLAGRVYGAELAAFIHHGAKLPVDREALVVAAFQREHGGPAERFALLVNLAHVQVLGKAPQLQIV